VNSDDNTVSEIDAATGTVVATYSVGAGPSAVAVANASAWVTNKDDSSVSQISEPSLITTAAAAPALATTGSSLAVPLGIVGILALAGGLGLMLLARRSSRSSR
jgi:YVTN family beta-propeller protein